MTTPSQSPSPEARAQDEVAPVQAAPVQAAPVQEAPAQASPVPAPSPRPPTRGQITFIIRRFLKPDVTPNWRRELPVFYGLWKAYPSLPFWQLHELGFPLNTMTWFLTEQGQSHLASTWVTFHYDPPAPEAAQSEVPSVQSPNSPVDKGSVPLYHVTAPARPRTTAEFLRGDGA